MRAKLVAILRNLDTYSKAIVAVLGGVSSALIGILGLGDVVPHQVAVYLLIGSTGVTAFSVWLVKNSDTIGRIGAWLANLLEGS